MPRDRLPAIESTDEFYYADLVGLPAFDPQGLTLGTILAVHNFGAGDLCWSLCQRQGGNTVFVPFTDQTVPEIDVAGRRVVIDYEIERRA